jgi:hypothetical protein
LQIVSIQKFATISEVAQHLDDELKIWDIDLDMVATSDIVANFWIETICKICYLVAFRRTNLICNLTFTKTLRAWNIENWKVMPKSFLRFYEWGYPLLVLSCMIEYDTNRNYYIAPWFWTIYYTIYNNSHLHKKRKRILNRNFIK